MAIKILGKVDLTVKVACEPASLHAPSQRKNINLCMYIQYVACGTARNGKGNTLENFLEQGRGWQVCKKRQKLVSLAYGVHICI